MIIQLIYWQSVCEHCGSGKSAADKYREHSTREQEAFERSLTKHRGRHYIRFS